MERNINRETIKAWIINKPTPKQHKHKKQNNKHEINKK